MIILYDCSWGYSKYMLQSIASRLSKCSRNTRGFGYKISEVTHKPSFNGLHPTVKGRKNTGGPCSPMSMHTILLHIVLIKLHRFYRHARSQSCPFCRDSLKRVNSGELWIYTSTCDIVDLSAIARENLKRLMIYIDKLPLVVPEPIVVSYVPHFR